jgi:hypothetical protein
MSTRRYSLDDWDFTDFDLNIKLLTRHGTAADGMLAAHCVAVYRSAATLAAASYTPLAIQPIACSLMVESHC